MVTKILLPLLAGLSIFSQHTLVRAINSECYGKGSICEYYLDLGDDCRKFSSAQDYDRWYQCICETGYESANAACSICDNDEPQLDYWADVCTSNGFTVAPLPSTIFSSVTVPSSVLTALSSLLVSVGADPNGTPNTNAANPTAALPSTSSASDAPAATSAVEGVTSGNVQSTRSVSSVRPVQTIAITMNGLPTAALPSTTSSNTSPTSSGTSNSQAGLSVGVASGFKVLITAIACMVIGMSWWGAVGF